MLMFLYYTFFFFFLCTFCTQISSYKLVSIFNPPFDAIGLNESLKNINNILTVFY